MEEQSRRKGFTIIEVALVLAVTGLILIGLIAGTSGAIARQRYNDSVQSVAENLRVYYSQVNNPQSISDQSGTKDRAIYGKLIIFSETNNNHSELTSYTIQGDAEVRQAGKSTASKDMLKDVNPSVISESKEVYTPPWDADIEDRYGKIFKGIILIIHSPNGGAVHTYVDSGTSGVDLNNLSSLPDSLETKELNLCVNSPDLYAAGGVRRNIRLAQDGRNSSAVELIDVDSGDNQCL